VPVWTQFRYRDGKIPISIVAEATSHVTLTTKRRFRGMNYIRLKLVKKEFPVPEATSELELNSSSAPTAVEVKEQEKETQKKWCCQ
jgi:hypothetical protein